MAVEVLTSKTCSEEGLEDVTSLLLNLSGPEATRDTILSLLLQGAQELGNVVRQNILDLQRELLGFKGIGMSIFWYNISPLNCEQLNDNFVGFFFIKMVPL